MWCPHCQSDSVRSGGDAVEASCRQCGRPLVVRKPDDTTIRTARDILARWSSDDLLDRISALPDIPPLPAPHFSGQAQASAEASPPSTTPADEDKQEGDGIPSEEREQPLVRDAGSKTSHPDEPQTESKTAAANSTMSTASDANADAATESHISHAADKKPVDRSSRIAPDSAVPPAADQRRISAEADGTAGSAADSVEETEGLEIQQPSPAPDLTVASASGSEIDDNSQTPPPAPRSPERSGFMSSAPDSKRRRKQPRPHQNRPQRDRKYAATDASKGLRPVSQKYRVDTPNPQQPEAAESPAADQDTADGRIQSNSPRGGRRYRIDASEQPRETLQTGSGRTRTDTPHRSRYIDEPHASAIRGPHFQVTTPRRSNLTAVTGQFLAYIGVLGLTIGTAMVIYGHFGGYAEYTPTGWLVTTVAQMMLFLGVINLVSGGMEQSNDDMSARINHLGEQLLRIEHVTEQALRGPKISARRYANPEDSTAETEPDTVAVGER